MKRMIFFLGKLLVIMMFFIPNCYAFDKNYKYNYEITGVSFNGKTGTIEGWAILNAGVNDGSQKETHGSPKLNRNLESTNTNPYSYNLRVYAISRDNGEIKEVKYINGTKKNVSNTSLYSIMCDRDDETNECIENDSPEYEKVGFNFNFDFADFSNSAKYTLADFPNARIDGYKFVLTVKSNAGTCKNSTNSSCSQSFPLTFLQSVVSKNSRKFFDSTSYMNKVTLVANDANVWSKKCFGGNWVKKINKAGGNYKLTDSGFCSSYDMTFYEVEVGNKTAWMPASWIAPPKDAVTIIMNDSCNVDGRSLSFPGVKNEVTTNSCVSSVILTDKSEASCITPDNTEYYKVTCEDNIIADFVPSKSKYHYGDDFDIDVKIKSYVSCYGDFDNELWSSHYSVATGTTKSKLEEIKSNFEKFSLNKYDAEPMGTMIYEVSNNPKNDSSIELKIKEKKDIASSKMEIAYTSLTKQVPDTFTYVSNTQEVLMNLNNPIEVNSDKENTPYKIVINNAGFSMKSKINFDCEIEKILAIYRAVDPDNPFINSERIIGKNWQNDKYDFTNVIKKEIWSQKTQYAFSISIENFADIKRNNHLLGVSAYLGSDCSIVNGKYRCQFIRDEEYFTEIFIRDERQ